MSLGGLSNCEGQLTDILEQPHNEAAGHTREQDIAHADETGWPRGNRQKVGCGLWVVTQRHFLLFTPTAISKRLVN